MTAQSIAIPNGTSITQLERGIGKLFEKYTTQNEAGLLIPDGDIPESVLDTAQALSDRIVDEEKWYLTEYDEPTSSDYKRKVGAVAGLAALFLGFGTFAAASDDCSTCPDDLEASTVSVTSYDEPIPPVIMQRRGPLGISEETLQIIKKHDKNPGRYLEAFHPFESDTLCIEPAYTTGEHGFPVQHRLVIINNGNLTYIPLNTGQDIILEDMLSPEQYELCRKGVLMEAFAACRENSKRLYVSSVDGLIQIRYAGEGPPSMQAERARHRQLKNDYLKLLRETIMLRNENEEISDAFGDLDERLLVLEEMADNAVYFTAGIGAGYTNIFDNIQVGEYIDDEIEVGGPELYAEFEANYKDLSALVRLSTQNISGNIKDLLNDEEVGVLDGSVSRYKVRIDYKMDKGILQAVGINAAKVDRETQGYRKTVNPFDGDARQEVREDESNLIASGGPKFGIENEVGGIALSPMVGYVDFSTSSFNGPGLGAELEAELDMKGIDFGMHLQYMKAWLGNSNLDADMRQLEFGMNVELFKHVNLGARILAREMEHGITVQDRNEKGVYLMVNF